MVPVVLRASLNYSIWGTNTEIQSFLGHKNISRCIKTLHQAKTKGLHTEVFVGYFEDPTKSFGQCMIHDPFY